MSLNNISNSNTQKISFNTKEIVDGVFSGFIATLVLTVLMVVKKNMGVMPSLDPVHMMSTMAAAKMGIAPNLVMGWVMHFVIGSIAWGGAFAVFNSLLPSKSQVKKGLVLGTIAWFMMMIGPMPISGSGLFGLSLGMMVPVMALALHLVYGAVLGKVFEHLIAEKAVEQDTNSANLLPR